LAYPTVKKIEFALTLPSAYDVLAVVQNAAASGAFVQVKPMRKLLPASIAAFILVFATFAGACGDKLLVLGRGVNFANLAAAHKGSIIAYVPATVPRSAGVTDPQFHAALQKAGHKLHLVQDASALADSVRSGQYDVILVDLQDAARVEEQVKAAGVNTVVMPVVYEGTELKTAEAARFGCVRKPSGKNRACLSTLDKAIELKLKGDERQRRASN